MSTPYGMPSSPPPSAPPVPPQKSRTPLYIGLACGCVLLLVLVVAGIGVGLFLIGKDAEEGPEPTSTSSPTDPGPTDEPSEDPTTGIETDPPVDQPTEGPSTESDAESVSFSVSAPEEGPSITTTDDETIEAQNGKFLGADLTIENTGSADIGLSPRNFRFYDADGEELTISHSFFQAPGPQVPPGETATGQLFADVPTDTQLAEVGYVDEVGTGGEELRVPAGG